ncbi:MAG: DNA-3-methyladenine glycosylase [Myxococcaceae bacterium]|nr:DNA-3-methyladenine glycosylase [Myxococcaceae bacterium]
MAHWRRSELEGPALRIARQLLGQVLVAHGAGEVRRGRIVEVEAYLGPQDLASHSRMGPTARNAPMFGPAGHAYVFLVYGMHHCFNVTTGRGAAVLIRGLEPLGAVAACDGPGKLSRALGITTTDSGLPLDGARFAIERAAPVAPRSVVRGPRVGVEYAGDWAERPYRLFVRGSAGVSRGDGRRALPVQRG